MGVGLILLKFRGSNLLILQKKSSSIMINTYTLSMNIEDIAGLYVGSPFISFNKMDLLKFANVFECEDL